MSLGAFMGGFANGWKLGSTIKGAMDAKELRELQAAEFAKVDNPEAIEASGAYVKGDDGSYRIKPELMTPDAAPGLGDAFRPTTEGDAMNNYVREAQAKGLMSPTEAMDLRGKGMEFETKKLGLESAKRRGKEEATQSDLLEAYRSQVKDPTRFAADFYGKELAAQGINLRVKQHPNGGFIAWGENDKGEQVQDARYVTQEQIEQEAFRIYQMQAAPDKYQAEQTRQKERKEEKDYRAGRDSVTDRRADAHLGLAQAAAGRAAESHGLSVAEQRRKIETEGEVRALRQALAAEKDPTQREAIKQRIEDLVGLSRSQNLAPRIAVGDDGVTRAIFSDGTQAPVDQLPMRRAPQAAAGSRPKTRAEADAYWPAYQDKFKSKKEFYQALGL